MSFKDKLRIVLDDLEAMLLEKNRKYGDSALNPARVFSKADPVEQIKVRIDDKLSRLARMEPDEDEDVVLDLMGYLALLRVAKGQAISDNQDAPRPWTKEQVVIQMSTMMEKLAEMWDRSVSAWDRDLLVWLATCPIGFTNTTLRKIICALVKGTKRRGTSVYDLLVEHRIAVARLVDLQKECLSGGSLREVQDAARSAGLDDKGGSRPTPLVLAGVQVLADDPRAALIICAKNCLAAFEAQVNDPHPRDAENSQVMVLASFGNPFREGENP